MNMLRTTNATAIKPITRPNNAFMRGGTGVAATREGALALVEKYQDRRLADRVFELAWTHSQVVLQQINASEADAQLYARLAGPVVYANAALRADPALLAQNQRGQSGLWGYSI